jgi:diguanylate cyclase (GGDEF)-like protein
MPFLVEPKLPEHGIMRPFLQKPADRSSQGARMKIETKFKAAALVIVAIMLFVAAAPILTNESLRATESELHASAEKERQLGHLLGLLRDAESGQRGFIITGKENFLGSYYAAIEQIPVLRGSLLALRADAPGRQQTLQEILRITDLKLAELAETIHLRRTKGFAEVEPIVSSERGKKHMDTLRALISREELAESERRDILQRELRRSAANIVTFGLGATLINLLLLAVLLLLMFRLLKDRKQTVQALNDTTAELSRSATETEARNRQMQLSAEMLQALGTIGSVNETSQVIASYCTKLLPDTPGVLYLYRNSRDILEAQASWGKVANHAPTMEPSDCWALKRGQPHLVFGPQDLCCGHDDPSLADAGGRLCMPLVTQGEVIGLLYLEGISSDAATRQAQQRLVTRVAEQVALALSNVQLRETLRRQSIIDPLTGLFNRRFMDETLRRELIRADRKAASLSLIVLDLDHFKHLNDTFGHDAGDAVLKATAQVIRQCVRESDLACRFGGEEMVVILPECDGGTARERAEKIRRAIASLDVQHAGRTLGTVTASLGVAVSTEQGTDAETLLRAADQALYQAKHGGRNRVAMATGSVAA